MKEVLFDWMVFKGRNYSGVFVLLAGVLAAFLVYLIYIVLIPPVLDFIFHILLPSVFLIFILFQLIWPHKVDEVNE